MMLYCCMWSGSLWQRPFLPVDARKEFSNLCFFHASFYSLKNNRPHEIIQMLEVQIDLLWKTTIKFWRVPSFLTDLLPLKSVLLSEMPSINAETSQYIQCIFWYTFCQYRYMVHSENATLIPFLEWVSLPPLCTMFFSHDTDFWRNKRTLKTKKWKKRL